MIEIQADPAVPAAVAESLAKHLQGALASRPGIYRVEIYPVGRDDEFLVRVTTPSGGRLPFLIGQRKAIAPEHFASRVHDALQRAGL